MTTNDETNQQQLTSMFAFDDEGIGLVPEILIRYEIGEVLVLFGHGVVDGERHQHARRRHADAVAHPQLAAAIARRLAAHRADGSGRGRRRRQRGRRALAAAERLVELVGLDRRHSRRLK